MGRRKPASTPHRPNGFGQLAKELHAQSGRDDRREVVGNHARRLTTPGPHQGKAMMCELSNAEKRGEVLNVGSEGKIIYDGWPQASKAAEEFFRLGGTAQYAYLCPRTADGHHHLTSRPPWRRFDVPGLHKMAELPAEPKTYREVEQAVSYEITSQRLRPPGDVMQTNDDKMINRWYRGEIDTRWTRIKKGTK